MPRTYFALLILCLCVTLAFSQKVRKREESSLDQKILILKKKMDRLLEEKALEAEIEDLNENDFGDEYEESYQKLSAPPMDAKNEQTRAHSTDHRRSFFTWPGDTMDSWLPVICIIGIIMYIYNNAAERNERILKLNHKLDHQKAKEMEKISRLKHKLDYQKAKEEMFQNKIEGLKEELNNQKLKAIKAEMRRLGEENENRAIQAANERDDSFSLTDIFFPFAKIFR